MIGFVKGCTLPGDRKGLINVANATETINLFRKGQGGSRMKHKKLAAIVVTTAMVVTNCMTAFAVEGDVNGSGTVEYDDSDAIALNIFANS